MDVNEKVIEKLGIKPFVCSDYLKDSVTRLECLHMSIVEDSGRDTDKWIIYCYEGILKERGELEDGQKLHR